MEPRNDEAARERYLAAEGDRLQVREVLALTPAERLDTLRVVDALFAAARPVAEDDSLAREPSHRTIDG